MKNAFPIKVRQYEKYQNISSSNFDFLNRDIFIIPHIKKVSIMNTEKYWIIKTKKYAASVRPMIFIASLIFSSFSVSKKFTKFTNGIIKGIKIKVEPAPPHSKMVKSDTKFSTRIGTTLAEIETLVSPVSYYKIILSIQVYTW